MSGVIELVVVIVLALAFAGLAVRAWRLRGLPVRIVSGVVASLLTLVLALVAVVGLLGAYRLYAPRGAPATNLNQQVTADQLATATRRANACTFCHSSTGELPLDGGSENLIGEGPIGLLVAPNLTPGGPLKNWTDGEIIRAIREGVDRDGHSLVLMPSEVFRNMSDSDVQATVAYLRAQPTSNRATSPRDLNLLGMMLIGAGLFPTEEQPHIAQPQSSPPAGVTPEYGQYLVSTMGCRTCHGANLEGHPPGGFGPSSGPALPPLVKTWQEAAFVSFFRTGVDPYGRSINPDVMPWQAMGKANTDDELRAIYAYIRSL